VFAVLFFKQIGRYKSQNNKRSCDLRCSYKTCYFSFVNKCKRHVLVRRRWQRVGKYIWEYIYMQREKMKS